MNQLIERFNRSMFAHRVLQRHPSNQVVAHWGLSRCTGCGEVKIGGVNASWWQTGK